MKKADKGGAVVILDIKDYTDEANRQLNDTNNYEQLDFDPTELHTEKIKSEINNLKNENLLTSKTANSFLQENIKTPEFHLLPKIHKASSFSWKELLQAWSNRISPIFYLQYLQFNIMRV